VVSISAPRPSSILIALLVMVVAAGKPSSAASSYTLKTLYSFCANSDCPDGQRPNSVIINASGDFFGTTVFGGAHNAGTVFELSPNSKKTKWSQKVLYSFCAQTDCKDGLHPFGSLILDINGNLYGITGTGGTKNQGVVFELSPGVGKKWQLNILYNFCSKGGSNCTDGKVPSPGLTYTGASSGIAYDGTSPLYGVTSDGGDSFDGTVFALTPPKLGKSKWTETVLHSFDANGTDGANPNGPLISDSLGNLYGTTSAGGPEFFWGVIFELIPNAQRNKWTETILYDFCADPNCSDGSFPQSGVIADPAGNLFGATSGGGTSDDGVVYKFIPSDVASGETVLHSFCVLSDCTDGNEQAHSSDITMDTSGNIFGTTPWGGGHDIDFEGDGGGTVFALDGTSFNVLYSFCAQAKCADGEYPSGALIVDGSGRIFGTTEYGGPNGGTKSGGTVFELVP